MDTDEAAPAVEDGREIAAGLKAIHAQENAQEARLKAQRLVEKYQTKFPAAMKTVMEDIDETVTFYRFPARHWRNIRTTNLVERLIREIRRRTDVVGAFPDARSAILLVCARVRWVTERCWAQRRYLVMRPMEGDEVDAKELAVSQ